MTAPNPPGAGLRDSLRALGATLLALVCTRVELIAAELHEQRERAEQKLVLVVLTALFLAMGMLLAAFLVIVLFWDTYRMLAAGGVTMLYLGIGGWALRRLRKVSHDSLPPFSATMSEFANDLRLLRGRDE